MSVALDLLCYTREKKGGRGGWRRMGGGRVNGGKVRGRRGGGGEGLRAVRRADLSEIDEEGRAKKRWG
jgi:hypothetical protein